MFTHCVINSTPSALRARPPRRGTVQVGFTEPLGRRPKGKATFTFDIVVSTLPRAGGVPKGGGGEGKLLYCSQR